MYVQVLKKNKIKYTWDKNMLTERKMEEKCFTRSDTNLLLPP